jgi:Tfp pilus assembly protein PilX
VTFEAVSLEAADSALRATEETIRRLVNLLDH